MRHKAGRIVAVLLVLLIIVGGGAVAAIYQKNSLAHVYFHKLTDKTEKTTTTAAPVTDETATSSTIDETKLKAQLKQLQFVGNVAVIQDGKLIYQQPYGQDPQKNVKTATTEYQIGALQNTLTAAAVMQLVKDGKLDLTTPVSKYYLLDNADASVTVGSLLEMTSGLTLDVLPASELNKDVIAWNLANATVTTTGQYNFQTVNYALLSGIIAQASGVSYQKFIKDTLLQPAGVKHTGFVTSAAVQSKLAPSFTYDKASDSASAVTQDTLFQTMNDQLGSKQLYTTASDMAQLTHYITSSSFVGEKYMHQGAIAKEGTAYTGRLTIDGSRLVSRADFAGYHNALAFTEDGKTGVVLLSNYQKDGSLSDTAKAILKLVQKTTN
ncbi:serine hydrolase domain-containing protein [Loigolactobacillus iwatensis]|uniref:serine hydrolase domain-containing protein n=1 Tax=Loigolactobacillus iwatensis TaxID=1267156 RepID=UPI000F7E9181|nr:serine hydrolase domain-containing protein [Loigolactobacillus iwatensis]